MFSRLAFSAFRSNYPHCFLRSLLSSPSKHFASSSSNRFDIIRRKTDSEQTRRFWKLAGLVSVSICISGAYYVYHIEEVPVSKRKRFIVTSIQSEKQLGDQSYSKLKQQYAQKSFPDTHPTTLKVKQIGMKLVHTSSTLKSRGYKWKFIVVDDPNVVNAFVVPRFFLPFEILL
jgi:hypothetical protein